MIVRTLWTNLIIQGITFATSVLTARMLGPTGRGELALILLYPQLVATLSLMGTDRAVAVLGGRRELDQPIATILKLTLLISIPAMVLGYLTVVGQVADPRLAKMAKLYLAYIPAVYFYLLVSLLFNGTGDFLRFNLSRLGFYCFNFVLLLIIWMSASRDALDLVVLANLGSVYGVCMIAALMFHGFSYTSTPNSESIRTTDIRKVFKLAAIFALPAGLAQLSGVIYQIILEHNLGVAPLGKFIVYFAYSRILSPVGNAISSHVFYRGINSQNNDISHICRISLMVYLLCSLPLWLLAHWLVPLIFGYDFIADLQIIGLLLLSSIFSLLADAVAEFLKGKRKVLVDNIGRIMYLVIVTGLGWWMATLFGLIGMAFSIALADFIRYLALVSYAGQNTDQAVSDFCLVKLTDISAIARSGKTAISPSRKEP